MRFAFLIFKYFPYGGVQRDMLRIANALALAGHNVDIFTMSWEGEAPQNGIRLRLIDARGMINHKRYDNFIRQAREEIARVNYSLVVGFNRMPGLDVYFAADPCFAERAQNQRGFFYRLSGRYRWFSKCERAVFAPEANCQVLLLSEREKADFQRWYRTPEHRFHLLPPYLSQARMTLHDKQAMRTRLRETFGFDEEDRVLLLVGSGFRTKGLDRAIEALAALPGKQRVKTRLLAVGQDNPKAFLRMAADKRLSKRVQVLPGRNDIPQLMQGADLLIHPARNELAGHVLLEAMASGLPVLVTDVCGYAFHIARAQAGVVLASPFEQQALNHALASMLDSEHLPTWAAQGIAYARAIMANNQGEAEANILTDIVRNKWGGADGPGL
ncbi:MAG TPA: glycosyltransferase family 4 protein [Methylophilaceae bacterium]|nr:glycosyltransferase family 4 protein [Methylophilaceae bacterium]